MYEIFVERHFDAAHYLRGYKGKCETMHGHRYKVVLRVKSPVVNDIGLAYDFTDLKRNLDGILGRLDHVCLNELPAFAEKNPSAENIATTIYSELKSGLAAENVTISAVEVWETPLQGAIYTPD